MDNLQITEVDTTSIITNDVDSVIITNKLIIDVSPYENKNTVTLTDSDKDEIELDAADLRAVIEAFIKINNIK